MASIVKLLRGLCMLCFIVSAHAIWSFAPRFPEKKQTFGFDWSSLPSSEKLEYRKCYEHFECARLDVPLDWSNLSNPNVVSIAIARLPATVDVSNKKFGGTIILNPGGPSGSGVDYLRLAGHVIQRTVDGDKHFEILSFDPRGVQFTTPSAACFDEDLSRFLYSFRNIATGFADSSDSAFNTKWAEAAGFGALCGITNAGKFSDGSHILNYMSTSLVAHDMVEIIDSIQEHREASKRTHAMDRLTQLVLKKPKAQTETPLLNYWGFSYGTYLGNTFASMFPSRIGRMILDGVVDADDYAATGWTTNLNDIDKTWSTFFQYCFEAGPKCPLGTLGFSDASQMQKTVETFLEKLKDDPIPVIELPGIDLLTFSTMYLNIFQALYFPDIYWLILSAFLKDLMQFFNTDPKTETLLNLSTTLMPFQVYPSPPLKLTHQPLPPYPASYEVAKAIICGDGDDLLPTEKNDLEVYLELLKRQSSIFGNIWAEVTLECRHWPKHLRPSEKNRFTGPFTSNLSTYDSRASPLLFFSTMTDPVTPTRNAYNMAAKHEGARVLIQDTPGHCAGAFGGSLCTSNVARKFFSEGVMPEHGSVCPGDRRPWDDE